MKSNPIKVRKGAWGQEEDNLLRNCVAKYGEGKWHLVPQRAGLNRCRKSCRLRWLNYLRPCIKRGEFTEDEVDLIIRLHKLLGNRWSLIAGRLPGRTANDIKNYWNTNLQKKNCGNSCRKEVVVSEVPTRRREEDSKSSSRVIKPLPRSLSRGTSVPCYSAPHNHSFLNNTPSTANNICNIGMLIDNNPLSPPPPDQDGIEWWKKLLDESITGEEEIESGGLSIMSSNINDPNGESGLFPVDDSLALVTQHKGVLDEDGHNGWADIWDLLNTDL